jgi:hypothetical protein
MESSSQRQDDRASSIDSDAGGSVSETNPIDSAAEHLTKAESEDLEFRRLVEEIGSDSASGTFAFYRLERYYWPED